jgi:hypothetical protein
LMNMKKQKEAELKEIRTALRQIIHRKKWERKQTQRGSMNTTMVVNQNHKKDNYGI